MRENEFTARVCKELRARGAMIYPLIAGAPGAPSGWPDRLVWSRPWRGLIEFKGANTPHSVLQRATLKELDRRGAGTAVTVRDAGDGVTCVVELPDGTEHARCTAGELLQVLGRLCGG